jgi:putative ABC transport system ATP-binding protein
VTPVLDFRGVSKSFGTGRVKVTALADIDLQVTGGEFLAVMGPSGSGKTTLLSLAGGLDAPTAGSVLFEGVDLATLSAAEVARLRRQRIGYVYQQFNLIEALTAAENVSLPLELDGRRQARRDALAALDLVGIVDLADGFPDELSGGEQQRVAIARAVVGDKSLLLADEPTGALDSATGERVLRLLREHCERGGTAVLVTHESRYAAWADRVVFLRDGRVADQTGPPAGPETLLRDPVVR